MATMTLRVNDEDAEIIRKYAEFEGKTISEFIRKAALNEIENQEDLEVLRQAIAQDNGERYTHDQVLAELGLQDK